MIFLSLAGAAGLSCAFLRYPFFLLLPVGVLLAVGATLMGIAHATYPGVIVAEVFGAIVVPQFLFAAVSLSQHLIRSSRLIPEAREAIGRQLRVELKAPRRLPPELAALVAQLGYA
jgi:hypothetical protein